MGESPRIPPFKKNGREKTKTPTKNGSRTWCNMLMGWCKSPTSTGNNISHLDLKHMYTYRARMYIWSILTISTQQVDTPKGALKKHLKGSGAAESHYDVPIPFQAMDPKSPDPPFAKCGDQKPEMIQSIKKIMKKRRLRIFYLSFRKVSWSFPVPLKHWNFSWEIQAPRPSLLLRIPSLFCFLLSKSLKARSNVSSSPSNSSPKVLGKEAGVKGFRALVVVKSISWQFLSSSFNCYLSPPPPYRNLFAPLIQPAIHLPTFKHLNCLATLHVPTSAFPPCSFHEFSHLPNAKPQAFLHFQKFKSVSPFPIVPKDRPHPVARGGRTFESLQVYTTILRNLCWCHPSYRKTHIYIQLQNAETYDKYICIYIYVNEIHDKYIWMPTWPRPFETGKSMFNPLQLYEGEKIQLQRWK